MGIRECVHTENRNKTVVYDVDVQVYFDVTGDVLMIIGGSEMPSRAS